MRLAFLGIDRAIALTLLNRAWSLLSGPLSIAFIVSRLSPVEQGFYYTFISVLGLQVFFELGLGFVIMQTVSHLVTGVSVTGRTVSGDEAALGRIGTLLADVFKFYSLLSGLFMMAAFAAGYWMFHAAPGHDALDWQLPWLAVVIVFGLTIVTNVLFNFSEGLGFIADTALGRLLQSVGAGLALWASLLLGAKLYALAFMYAANVLGALLWMLLRHRARFAQLFARRSQQYRMNWRKDIWPFQWRIAASWISGYLASLAITPIVFRIAGPVPAGQIGLSLSIASAASFAALAWVSTKAATFGRLVAERDFPALEELYASAFRRAMIIAVAMMLLLVLATELVCVFLPHYAARILPPGGMIALAVATIFNIQISAQSYYLRAFRKEPFMAVSIANGVCLSLSAAAATYFFGIIGVAIAYALVTGSIAVFWCWPLFQKSAVNFRKEVAVG